MSLPTLLRPALVAVLVAGASAAAAQDAAAPVSASAPAPAAAASASSAEDPYVWLEKVDSPEAMAWVRAENRKTLDELERDPRFQTYHQEALTIAQNRDRIPMASQVDGRIFNFWQDADHVRGIWRATSQQSSAAAPISFTSMSWTGTSYRTSRSVCPLYAR